MKALQSDGRRAVPWSRLALASMVVAFLAGLVPAPAAAEPKATAFRLANGIQVVVVPDHRLPLAAHGIWYKVGASDDPENKHGLAHFLEHLMFKGTEKYPSGSFNRLLDSVGGSQNATTDSDVTAYFQMLPRKHLELVMQMEADRMRGLLIDDAEVIKERNVVLEERKMRIDNSPTASLYKKIREALYAGHPYFHHAIGSEAEIRSYTRDDALSFYREWYQPGNAVVVISGDLTVEDARALAEKTYGGIPAGEVPSERAVFGTLQPVTVHRVQHTHERVTRPGIVRYYRLPKQQDLEPGEAEALSLLGAALGSNTGRLYRAMVMEQNLASSVSARYTWNLAAGEFRVSLDAAKDRTPEQLEAGLAAVLDTVRRDGITADELEIERNAFLGRYIMSTDSMMTTISTYGSWLARGRSVADVEGWIDRINQVTVEDVNKVARKYLDPETAVTGVLLPSKHAATQQMP